MGELGIGGGGIMEAIEEEALCRDSFVEVMVAW